jgi:hypothetical protein
VGVDIGCALERAGWHRAPGSPGSIPRPFQPCIRLVVDQQRSRRRHDRIVATAFLADLVLVFHGLFILWAAFGALAVWRWRWLAWLHLPATAWAAGIVIAGGICPLTPLEIELRRQAGQTGYDGSFIDHYLAALIYPEGLTRPIQIALGIAVIAINLGLYAAIWRKWQHPRTSSS